MVSHKNCWTCKARKIGCDRNTPSCKNCIRTNRICLGYGIRLLWPDHRDGRRRELDFLINPPRRTFRDDTRTASQHYGKQFLNFTIQDMDLVRGKVPDIEMLIYPGGGPRGGPSLHIPLFDQDALLLSYYETVVSPMISTTQARNGFYVEILPMALSSRTAASSALCNALLSIAAFHHLGRPAALPYKMKALSQLSHSVSASVNDLSPDDLNTQLGACLMLCMYSVFDSEEGNWHIHLKGAQEILRNSRLQHLPKLTSNFLIAWFLYYDVLSNFTQSSHKNSIGTGRYLEGMLDTSKIDTSVIVGSLGCSLELFDAIHHINRLRAVYKEHIQELVPPTVLRHRTELESQLRHLDQHLDPDEEATATPSRRAQALTTAELYRLAALLYLERVCPVSEHDDCVITHLEEGFCALETLNVASSPWPVFILACESRTESQRITILQTLDDMETIRGIGNILVMRDIIEKVWKQSDLRLTTNSSERFNWCQFIQSGNAVPWFV